MWIEEYKTNREVALVQLMQFFINSSGCRGKVSPDMAQMDHTLIIKKMTQEFDEVSSTKSKLYFNFLYSNYVPTWYVAFGTQPCLI